MKVIDDLMFWSLGYYYFIALWVLVRYRVRLCCGGFINKAGIVVEFFREGSGEERGDDTCKCLE